MLVPDTFRIRPAEYPSLLFLLRTVSLLSVSVCAVACVLSLCLAMQMLPHTAARCVDHNVPNHAESMCLASAGERLHSSGIGESGMSLVPWVPAADGPAIPLSPCMRPGCSMRLSGLR